jgi:hypothetical protein
MSLAAMKHLALILFAVLLCSCSEARRMEKKRSKAEALVKEAIETFPGIIQPVVTTDTIHVISPAVVITERIGYTQPQWDSLRAICADLVQAAEGKERIVVQRLTSNVCHFDTARFYREPLDIMVWTEGGALQLVAVKHAEQLDTAVVTSTRTINATPCPPKERVRSWFWVGAIIGFILGAAAMLFVRGGNKYE